MKYKLEECKELADKVMNCDLCSDDDVDLAAEMIYSLCEEIEYLRNELEYYEDLQTKDIIADRLRDL